MLSVSRDLITFLVAEIEDRLARCPGDAKPEESLLIVERQLIALAAVCIRLEAVHGLWKIFKD